MKNKKKISDFLINEKISLNEKQHVMVLCSGKSVLWVIGKRIDNRFKINENTSSVIEIRLETIKPEDCQGFSEE
jgi:tRNA(Ile)-lysidine synthase